MLDMGHERRLEVGTQRENIIFPLPLALCKYKRGRSTETVNERINRVSPQAQAGGHLSIHCVIAKNVCKNM